MAPATTIRLFEVEPDLIRFLSEEDRAEAEGLELPLRALPPGLVDVRDVFARTGSFGAILVDGMLLQTVRLGQHSGLRLLGPGDLLSLTGAPRSVLVLDTECRATVPTTLALFERETLVASRRWPRLVAGLHTRSGEQLERLLIQLMICQLPRVDDRVLSLMWLLAESWGRVTPSGTELPVSLTHEALGGLVGARRPTVTLALGELTTSGAILRRDGGWLLLRRPPSSQHKLGRIEDPRPLELGSTEWSAPVPPAGDVQPIHQVLRETVLRLQDEHLRSTDQVRDRLLRAAATRARVAKRRARVPRATVRLRRAPS